MCSDVSKILFKKKNEWAANLLRSLSKNLLVYEPGIREITVLRNQYKLS